MSASVKFLCLYAMHTQGWFSDGKTGLKEEKIVIIHS